MNNELKKEIQQEIDYEKRINRVIDSIENYGFTIINENIELDNCSFEIEEIKDWMFNIELLDNVKNNDDYIIDAILWGMWKPGIEHFKKEEAFYKQEFIIDKYKKINKRFYYEGPQQIRELLLLIIKKKWYANYYSMSNDNKKFNYHYYLWYKLQCKQLLFTQNLWKIKDFITNMIVKIKLYNWKHEGYISSYNIVKSKNKIFYWNTLPMYNIKLNVLNHNILNKLQKYYNYNITVLDDKDKEDNNV